MAGLTDEDVAFVQAAIDRLQDSVNEIVTCDLEDLDAATYRARRLVDDLKDVMLETVVRVVVRDSMPGLIDELNRIGFKGITDDE